MKEIPFNLEAAKAGAPIQTRNGEPRRFSFHEPRKNNCYTVYAMDPDGQIGAYTEAGSLYGGAHESDSDLVMVPKSETVHFNVYRGQSKGVYFGKVHRDRSSADDTQATMGELRIACLEITFTEGQGL